ncbi:ABC transporter permease [Rhizobium puerariae]|uniref:ABC transporter permease n=1 Tax=Rhizobium puerariae TaxID=1585791 RepID=A0ABV6AG03_9HYPH
MNSTEIRSRFPRILKSIRLYALYLRLSINAQAQYKSAFIIQSLGQLASSGMGFVGIWALLSRFGSFQTWNIYTIGVLYGLINTSFALAEAFGRGFDVFGSDFVRNREFDRLLSRPRSPILQLLGHEVRIKSLGRLLQGVFVLVFCLANAGDFTLGSFLVIVWCIVGGFFLFLGIFIIQATLSFWTIDGLEVMNGLTYGGVQAAQYPVDVYPGWIRFLFIFVVPFSAVAYFPTDVLLHYHDHWGVVEYVKAILPILGLIFFCISTFLFRVGISYYISERN